MHFCFFQGIFHSIFNSAKRLVGSLLERYISSAVEFLRDIAAAVFEFKSTEVPVLMLTVKLMARTCLHLQSKLVRF